VTTKNQVRFFCCLCISNFFFFTVFSQIEKPVIKSYLPLPHELGAWQIIDSTRTFDENSLFDLIDGGADMYLEYGFQQVISASYQNKENLSIAVEIYEMKNAAAAFGMYSMNIGTQGKNIPIGNEGKLYNNYLMFWKDRFLVFLSAADTTHETSDGMVMIANTIDRKLGSPGKKPGLVQFLPADDLITSKYFKGMLGFSSLYTFDTQNIFGMKEGVSGDYPNHRVFILAYDTEKEAEDHYVKLQDALRKNPRFFNYQTLFNRSTMTDQKNVHLCMTYVKNLIAVVMAQNNSNVAGICDRLILSLQNK
jgi:hypothetical protein